MKTKSIHSLLSLAAAGSFGLAAPAFAQEALVEIAVETSPDLAPPSTPAKSEAKSKITITIEEGDRATTRTFEVPSGVIKLAKPLLEVGLVPSSGAADVAKSTFLGVTLDEAGAFFGGADNVSGVKISEVLPDSPAAGAGLQKGDVLKKFDDQVLVNPPQLTALVRARKEGDTVTLTFEREGKEQTAEVALTAKEEGRRGWGLSQFHYQAPKDDAEALKALAKSIAGIGLGEGLFTDPRFQETLKSLSLAKSIIGSGDGFGKEITDFLGGKIIRIGDNGEVVVESVKEHAADDKDKAAPLATRRFKRPDLADFQPQIDQIERDKQRELRRKADELGWDAGATQPKVVEDLRKQVAEWRENWAKAQQTLAKEQSEAMKKLHVELQKANEAARRAQEDARKALEKIQQEAGGSSDAN